MPVAPTVVVRVAMTLGPLALAKSYSDKLGLKGVKAEGVMLVSHMLA
jgi:hypothetical protein